MCISLSLYIYITYIYIYIYIHRADLSGCIIGWWASELGRAEDNKWFRGKQETRD